MKLKIIINADDFGMTRSINDAIIELAKKGRLSSTSVMVGMPFAEEACELEKLNIGVGLHVNLTQGKSVLEPEKISTIVDSLGNFYSTGELAKRIRSKMVNKQHVFEEIEAQYNRLKLIYGGEVTHFDSHQGVNKLKIVTDCISEVSNKYKIKIGLRYYNKIYLLKRDNIYEVKKPVIKNLTEFKLTTVLKDYLIRLRRRELDKTFRIPSGILLTIGHRIEDVLQALIIHNGELKTTENLVVEIGCHPATGTNDLFDTELVQERVNEFELLNSLAFLKALEKFDLCDYRVLAN